MKISTILDKIDENQLFVPAFNVSTSGNAMMRSNCLDSLDQAVSDWNDADMGDQRSPGTEGAS